MVVAERERTTVATRSVLDEITSKTRTLRKYVGILTATANETSEIEEIGNRRRIVTHGWIEYQNIDDQDRLEESQLLPHFETWDNQVVEIQGIKVIRHIGLKLILKVFLGDGTSVIKPGVIYPARDHNGRLREFLTILHPRNNINNTTKY